MRSCKVSSVSNVLSMCVVLLLVAGSAYGQTIYLHNGSFSQDDGSGGPSEWGTDELGDSVGMWRDTENYYSAPASLGMQGISVLGTGGNTNQAFQPNPDLPSSLKLPALPGEDFTFEAQVKIDSASGGNAAIVIHFVCHQFWEECDPSGWMDAYWGGTPTADWVTINETMTVPSGTSPNNPVWALVRIVATGQITFHVDDIKINGQEEFVDVESAVAAQPAPRLTVTGNTVTFSNPSEYTLSVLGLNGQKVTTLSGFGRSVDLMSSQLPSGTYVVHLTAPKAGSLTTRMMVNR